MSAQVTFGSLALAASRVKAKNERGLARALIFHIRRFRFL